MKKKTIAKRKIRKECWSLDTPFLKWLLEHLKVFYKDASRFIDLEYYHYTFKEKDYSEGELIKKLIDLVDYTLNMELPTIEDDKRYWENIEDICEMWKMLLPSLWW